MKHNELKRKMKIYSYIIIGLLAILCLRLTDIQLLKNDVYQTQAKDNRIRLVAIKAPRGEIYARDGEVFAANELVYTLSLTFLGLSKQDQVVEKLVEVLDDYYPEVTAKYIDEKIELQKYRLFEPIIIMRDIPWELVVKLEENRQELPGVAIRVEPLRYYPNESLAGHVLGYIHSINQQELSDASGDKYNINSLIGKTGIEKQYEQELRGKDGARRVEVDAKGRPVRELVTMESKPGNNIYLTLDMNLQKVLENSMEETLKNLQQRYPKAKVGSAVVLNVKTGEVLAMYSSPSMYPDDWKGELGTDRASYYYPQGNQYDPMSPGAETNRAIQVSYPPGSTFKPITGMAALEKGEVDSLTDLVTCKGSYWIAPYIKCWSVHGNVNYYAAMAGSCNVYFQEMGRRAGKEEIIRVAAEFGLGQKTGIDIPGEISGQLPTPAWKKEVNAALINRKYEQLREQLDDKYRILLKNAKDEKERGSLEKQEKSEKARLEAQYKIDYNFDTTWQPFDTFNMSIGQGYNEFTVLQLTNYCATIANGGYLMQPYIAKKIVSDNGRLIKEFKPQVIRETKVAPETIAETKRAMLAVTQPKGTAHFLFYQFPPEIQVAAKTGTAETGRAGDNSMKEFHGVFIAFAPFDDPEIAFAGVVEYGYSGGESAGIVCRDVFEQYFGIKDHLAEEDKNMVNTTGE
ncbi:MAG: penicillin-binding protein 2 [Syntrophomonadaceae bacterium]|nr:penicillin-binding protein 2 [Syntrophomonadaceae bacterium]